MAILCIRILANNNPTDPSKDIFRTQEGDIVCVTDNAHVFSFGELNCGQYRFIRITDGTEADMSFLLDSVFDASGNMTRVRKLGLDAVVLSGGVWKSRTTATKAQLSLVTVVKV